MVVVVMWDALAWRRSEVLGPFLGYLIGLVDALGQSAAVMSQRLRPWVIGTCLDSCSDGN